MKKGIVFFLMILVITAFVSAQNMQELRIGSFLSGNLSRGQEFWYSVRPQETGFLIVETAGNTDTYMQAYDSNNNYIASDDDSGEAVNALIHIYVRADEIYYFRVTGYDGTAAGQFRILASLNPLPPITEIRLGSFAAGTINYEEGRWFSVRASAPGYIIVEATGGYSFMELYDENFNFLNDSSEGYSHAIKVNAFTGQLYNFYLYSYEDSLFNIAARYQPFPAPVQLSAGTFQSGYIDYGEEYWYVVRTVRRGLLVVETTGGTDTVLFVYDESYNFLASNDDFFDTNARIEIDAQTNQTFIFLLRGFGGYSSGAYRIFAGME